MLIPERQLLLKDETPVRIGARALEILTALVERAGDIVSKRELLSRVWPDTIVEESNLKVNVAALRKALGEAQGTTRYIAAVSGRGYRFVTPVQSSDSIDPMFVASAASTRNNKLPTATTRIIGRTDAILAIRLALSDSRLVSVVGAGGIGKTTVAIAVAQQFEDEGVAAATFVDLSRVASEEFVPASLLAALGINSGSQDSLQAVVSILAKRKTLLLFDTCEHVLNAVAHICNVLLANTSNVRILATSRQVLRAHGEKVEWLAPLDVPLPGHALTTKDVLQYSAPQLLADRAFEKAGYVLADADAPALADICRRLDGAPLAIELVSSRLAGRSADTVLNELDDRFRTLRRDSPGGPLRQQTLLATLEWSYALLTTVEATVFRTISIFAGSFDMDSVVAVTAHHGLARIHTSDAIAGLRAKSMLSVDQRSGEPRYRLLDTARAFAGSLLDDQQELTTVSASHARLQLEILTRAGTEQVTMPASTWRATFGNQAEDLRKAVNWALNRSGDPLLGIQLVAAGLPLWNELSLGEESRRNCEQALAEYERIGCADQLLKLKLVVGLATLNTYLSNEREKTVALYETAIQLAREIGDATVECHALGALAIYTLLPGRQSAVSETLDAMRQTAIRANDRSALWEQEQIRAEWECLRGDFTGAQSRLERLRAEVRSHSGDLVPRFQMRQETRIEVFLGALHWFLGKPGEALRVTEKAAREAMEVGHGLTLIYCMSHGAIWTLSECHEYEAARFYTEVLKSTIYRHGMPAWIPIVNCYSEAIAALSGARPSPESLRTAFDDLRNGMSQLGHPSYYAMLAKAMIAIGQADDAARTIAHARQTSRQRFLPELLRLRAATERAYGRDDDAEVTLRESLRLADFCLPWRLRSAADLAALLRDRGDCAQARAILAPVYGLFTDGLDTGDLRYSRELLAQLG